jgi:2-oxoglutarate dehydrogenase E1 component
MLRDYRAPLVIFTPKSLLRHPKAAARVSDFTQGNFQRLIDDRLAAENPGNVRRLILCSGKVYYDLVAEREERFGERASEIAIVRLEELYPWPEDLLTDLLVQYSAAGDIVWCQEEPQNMGPWTFVWPRLQSLLGGARQLRYAGRAEAASPATGSPRIHKAQLAAFLEEALADRSS